MAGLIPADELEYSAIPKRRLTEDTCRKFSYATTTLTGRGAVQVAAYRDEDGAVAAHKVRTRDKDFFWLGEPKRAVLFGQHLCRDGGRRIIVTEGEIDALTVAQVLGKWPAVSVPNGAQGAKKDLSKHLDFLNSFDEIVLCFDEDEPGREAVAEVAPLFPPGKVKVVSLPLKDANAMLQADKAGELVEALWNAKTWRPKGIRTLAEIRPRILSEPEYGYPWFCDTLTNWTYGRRLGELVALGGGSGCGKTDLITQQVAFDVTELGERVGLFFLEQTPDDTGKRLAGKVAGRRFHIPDDGWTVEELDKALDTLGDDRVFFFDHFGATDADRVIDTIRVLHHSEGVRFFYLDHITALAAQEDDERKFLEGLMARLGGLVKEIPIWLLFVSHLSTPEGRSHEEGGRVMMKHFKGSRAIQYWAHFMIGLERDTQAEDLEERHTTLLRMLKDRNTGRSTGKTRPFGYDDKTGLMFEKDAPAEPEDTDAPF